MKFHPYADAFPLIESDDFAALVADIKAHGLREKVVTYRGQILDGRNRFLACQRAKVKPQFREFKGDDAAALAFVVSVNMHRRHLTESQRAMAAARIATLPKGTNQHAPIGAPSQDEAAESLKVGRRSVQRAKDVIEHGSKALQHAVDSGEVSVSKAAAVTDLPKSEQLAAAKAKPEPKPVEVAPAPDFDFSGYVPEDDDEYRRNIENVMMADDKLAAMREEIAQVRREMAGLKSSRDHYQHEAGAAVRLVKARDREIEKLRRQLEKVESENEKLRERVAIMEAA